MVCRFVQLSDIHFGQERDGTLPLHEDVRDMLLKDVAWLAEKRGPASLVLVAGDIAYSGHVDEYRRAGSWLDKLTKAAGCKSETDVRVVPGNHDCDRSRINTVTQFVHRNLRGGSPNLAYQALVEFGQGEEDVNPLLPKLRSYRDFAAGYESDFASVGCPSWTRDFALSEGRILRLVGMNSVQVSDTEDRPGNMILGNTQYQHGLPDRPGVAYAVMMHHPIEWFMDKAEAKTYLRNRARLMVVGHEHISEVSKSVDMFDNEFLEIRCGSTNPPEALFHFAYNWIEICTEEHEGAPALSVAIFPRVWVPQKTRFEADSLRLPQGSEFKNFRIACPELAVATSTSESPPAEKPNDTPGEEESVGEPMSTIDEAAMAKLKFLFWRYLDWQQRLKVLVEADALPPSADQPIPQTMERAALENAKERGKLGAIWEAMMPFVPDAKRQANPF